MVTYRSTHFSLQPLAEGVFGAITYEAGAVIGNADLVNLDWQLIVFNTFMATQAAVDLGYAIEILFGRTPELVVYSHYQCENIHPTCELRIECIPARTLRMLLACWRFHVTRDLVEIRILRKYVMDITLQS